MLTTSDLVAVATALCGGGLVKLGEIAYKRWRDGHKNHAFIKKTEIEDGAAMRRELWAEIKSLRDQAAIHDRALRDCHDETLAMRAAYLALRQLCETLRTRCTSVEQAITACSKEHCAAIWTLGPMPPLPDIPWDPMVKWRADRTLGLPE